MAFAREGADWPNREASAFVEAGGLRWHVQTMGTGPDVLMVHGTGASTHSWEGLAPLLAQRFHLVAPDLPGHGFTEAKRAPDLSLPGMARALAALLGVLDFSPQIVVGHSAGAAILARLCLDGTISPKLFVSLNGAFLPFGGLGRVLFPSMAKLCFSIRSRLVFLPGPPTRRRSPTSSRARDRRSDRAASSSTRAFSTIPAMSPARWA